MSPRFELHLEHVRRVVDAVLLVADPRRVVVASFAARKPRPTKPAVIAVGKAAAGMYEGWRSVAGDPPHAVIVVPRGPSAPDWALRAEHPVPGEGSANAGAAVEKFITGLRGSVDIDGFVLLLSGGASALLAAPAAGLGIEDVAAVTRGLLRSGVSIVEFNRVRKHIDRLKGGRMAVLMSPKIVDAYLLSDVPQDDLSALGSGPVLPDGSTYEGALAVLRASGVTSPRVAAFLEAGAKGTHPETPKPGDEMFKTVRCLLVGSNADATKEARARLASLGFSANERPVPPLTGEASQAGRELAMLAKAARGPRPTSIVMGGETTVRVGPGSGVGGRNQELALAAALEIDGNFNVAIASLGTDGVDGPTDAAGAIVTGETCRQARSIGLDPAESLRRHDSNGLFASLERAGHPHLIRTGPTGTNVNDIAMALMY